MEIKYSITKYGWLTFFAFLSDSYYDEDLRQGTNSIPYTLTTTAGLSTSIDQQIMGSEGIAPIPAIRLSNSRNNGLHNASSNGDK